MGICSEGVQTSQESGRFAGNDSHPQVVKVEETWVTNALPEKMCFAQCFVLDNAILIAGSHKNASCYILENGTWNRLTDLPFTPLFPAVALTNNLLYSFHFDEICTFKMPERKWEKLDIKSKVEYKGSHRVVGENGFIFVTYNKRWDVFDTRRKAWIFEHICLLAIRKNVRMRQRISFAGKRSVRKPPSHAKRV